MLIEIKAHTGIEFINPAQITHVSIMRGYILIHFTSQEMIPVDLVEWDEVKPLLVKKPQSGFEASAEDNNTSSTDNELPF